MNDYFTGILDASGVEYHGDSAYDYWKGFVGIELKKDAGALTCKNGTPCGKRCLPKGQKCRSALGKVGSAAGKVGDLLLGNTYTDLRRSHAKGEKAGKALLKAGAKLAARGALGAAAVYGMNKSMQNQGYN